MAVDVSPFNRPMLDELMKKHGDKKKDLAAALGMAYANFSPIWNGRQSWTLRHVIGIQERYKLTPRQVFDLFIRPEAGTDPASLRSADSEK